MNSFHAQIQKFSLVQIFLTLVTFLFINRLPRVDDLKEQVYEIDTDIEQRDLVSRFK